MKIEMVTEDHSISTYGWNISIYNKEYDYINVEITTQYGYVLGYAQGNDETQKHTRLDFIWQGRQYTRSFNNKRYTKRGMVTKGKQFAEEIINEI